MGNRLTGDMGDTKEGGYALERSVINGTKNTIREPGRERWMSRRGAASLAPVALLAIAFCEKNKGGNGKSHSNQGNCDRSYFGCKTKE